jgi:hypothetical protein
VSKKKPSSTNRAFLLYLLFPTPTAVDGEEDMVEAVASVMEVV